MNKIQAVLCHRSVVMRTVFSGGRDSNHAVSVEEAELKCLDALSHLSTHHHADILEGLVIRCHMGMKNKNRSHGGLSLTISAECV